MKWYFQFALLSVLSGVFVSCAQNTFGQGVPQADPPQTGVVMTKLSAPIYPPLARQARIMGDVKIQVSIHKDGSVDSAEMTSGHPLLKQAAIESARNSRFECRGCDRTESYNLVYTFKVDDLNGAKPDPCCCSRASPPERHLDPDVKQFPDHVTVIVTAEPVCICPDECELNWAEEHSRFRAAKCLYLWKCGVRHISIE